MFRGFLLWLTEAAAFWTSFGVLLWHELLFYGSFTEIPIYWMQVSFPCSDCLCVVFFTVSCLYCVQMPFLLISTMEKLAWSQLILHHTVDYQLLVHLINNKNRHEIPFQFHFWLSHSSDCPPYSILLWLLFRALPFDFDCCPLVAKSCL
jgi:hypothetical protein